MSIELYYYSGTGNSLYIAKELQKSLPDVSLVPIISCLNSKIVETKADTVGFVFPQYASTFPKMVGKFLETLKFQTPKYIFAIITRGAGESFADIDLDKILMKSGNKLNAFFIITMPGGNSAILKNCSERLAPERIGRLSIEVMNKLKTIQKIIFDNSDYRKKDTEATIIPPFWMRPLLPMLLTFAKKIENKFSFYSDEKCNGCGVCSNVCLANRIEIINGKPIWLKGRTCYACWACLCYCPKESIQIKSKWYVKSFTEKNRRYHHPDISAIEIAKQKFCK